MRRILVVDDDLHTRLAIRIWLSRCGFRVAIADGSVNGLAALDDSTFDLMIVDILMPNMRGFESIRIFHQRAPTRRNPCRRHDRDLRTAGRNDTMIFFEGEAARLKTSIFASGG